MSGMSGIGTTWSDIIEDILREEHIRRTEQAYHADLDCDYYQLLTDRAWAALTNYWAMKKN